MKNKQQIDKNKFKVPTSYFDDLEQTIYNKTIDAPRQRTSIIQFVKPWMGVAASVVMLALATFLWFSKPESNQMTASADGTEQLAYAELDDMLYDELFAEADDDHETLNDLADFLLELEDME